MFIYNAVLAFNSWIWGIPILIILIGGGLYLSFITGFVQVRHFPTIIKSTVGSMFNKEEMKEETGKHHGTISSFQAVSAALAAVLGTGNIVGVGTAIAAGGPGAIFWMWVVGFVAMALKYSEACVSIAVREKKPEGGYKGGANYYLSKINKPLGFAWSIAIMYGLITAAGVHTGSVVTAAESLGVPRLVATIIVCIIIALIIFGGLQALVQITERLVPFHGSDLYFSWSRSCCFKHRQPCSGIRKHLQRCLHRYCSTRRLCRCNCIRSDPQRLCTWCLLF